MKTAITAFKFALIGLITTSCSESTINDVPPTCPESHYDDRLDLSQTLSENTMIYKNKVKSFTSVTNIVHGYDNMYEIEASCYGFELWVRIDLETLKNCRNTVVTSSVLPSSFPDKGQNLIGIVMYDHYNYIANETLQTSNTSTKVGYAEILYNENDITVKINNLSLNHMTFWQEPEETLSFHITAPYPTN